MQTQNTTNALVAAYIAALCTYQFRVARNIAAQVKAQQQQQANAQRVRS